MGYKGIKDRFVNFLQGSTLTFIVSAIDSVGQKRSRPPKTRGSRWRSGCPETSGPKSTGFQASRTNYVTYHSKSFDFNFKKFQIAALDLVSVSEDRVFHGFGQAKFPNGGLVFQFSILSQLLPKILINSKVVKIDPKTIITL